MRTIDWLFRDRTTGRIVVAQLPNLSLGIFLAATIARRVLDPAGTARTVLVVVATGALLWWAADEVVRGVNPWRRILGAVVGGAVLVGLARVRLVRDVAQGRMTDPGRHRDAVSALPGDLDALIAVVQGLVVHEHLAAAYGVTISDEARTTVHERRASVLLDRALALNPAPLDVRRPPDRRIVGNCRQVTVLITSLLRAHGVPARARCGFGAYIVGARRGANRGAEASTGSFEDHWVCERWSAADDRWTLVDAQMDRRQREWFGLDFPITDVPRDRFVVAGDAWTRYRAGEVDPDRFGLSLVDEGGWWWIAANLMRDAAALTGTELLPWDLWGAMPGPEATPDDDVCGLFDRLATLTGDPDRHRDELDRTMADDERVRVPPAVFNAIRGTAEPI